MTEQCPSLLIVRAIAVLASCLVVAGMAAAGPQAARGAPVLAHRVAIPAESLTPRSPDKPDQKFGGDVRIGDLNGDGEVDFVVFKSVAGAKPCFIGAFDLRGDVLWSFGDKERKGAGGDPLPILTPRRPGPVAIHDIDGDGKTEAIAIMLAPGVETTGTMDMAGTEFVILDGATGKVKKRAAPAELVAADGYVDGKYDGSNWVHHRILIANLRGKRQPQDFVIKLGKSLLAFDNDLALLWSYDIRWNFYPEHSAYVPAVGDIDGDGRDEVTGGHYLLDHDGTPLWEKQRGPHMDSVAIAPWDDGKMRAILSGSGQVVDEQGHRILNLGRDIVHHGQEVRCGDVRADSPGNDLVFRPNGHQANLIVVGQEGTVLAKFDVPDSPNNTGIEIVYWDGPGQVGLIYSPAALFDGDGKQVSALDELPPPTGGRMGWYHCIPANVCGDEREELVLYDPEADTVFVYTPAPFDKDAFKGYAPGPRQYNPRIMD